MSAPETLSVTEQHQLLDALMPKCATHKQHCQGIRNRTIALLMLDAGLRVGEVVQLLITDLYYNEAPVENLVVTAEIAKRHRERSIPVSTRLSQSLQSYWQSVLSDMDPANRFFAFFNRVPHVHISSRQVERFVAAAAYESLGRPVNPHVLRHTFASKLMRVTNIRTVQELLGHKHLSSTQIYTHPNEDDKRRAISNIDTYEVSNGEVTNGL